MKGLVSYILLVIISGSCLIFIFHTTSRADISREDSTEFRENLLPAQQGDAKAQVFVGYLYETGQGVTQNYTKAAEWYQRAAVQGNAGAQAQLGNMYYHGRGVSQNYVQSYMWLDLSARQGNKQALKFREIVAGKMSREQIGDAKRMAGVWRLKRK
jgi:uncharacterized protein